MDAPIRRLIAALGCLAALALATPAFADGFEVAATGDLITHSKVSAVARKAGGGWNFQRFFSNIGPLIAGADLAICHQETVIGPGPPRGFPRFRGPRAIPRAEAAIGWDACSTASNHSFDHGAKGIDSTLDALNSNGIAHAGTYRTRSGSEKARLIKAHGHRVALLSYTGGVNPSGFNAPAWQPERTRFGRILADARRARRAGAEAVIVNLHWGHDVEPEPGARRIAYARRLLDHHAISALIGQGPHVVWPIEFFHGKPAVMSEGNLLYAHDPRNQGWEESGIVALLKFHPSRGKLRATGVRYVPLTQRRDDLKLFTALGDPPESAALQQRIRDDYIHATEVIGSSDRVQPLPANPPPRDDG